MKRELAPYKYPREIEFIEALPRTDTGKVQRYVLRDRAKIEPKVYADFSIPVIARESNDHREFDSTKQSVAILLNLTGLLHVAPTSLLRNRRSKNG